MTARVDYPHRIALDVSVYAVQYEQMCNEIDRLRAVAREAWEWDEVGRLPGRLPELLDALGWDERIEDGNPP